MAENNNEYLYLYVSRACVFNFDNKIFVFIYNPRVYQIYIKRSIIQSQLFDYTLVGSR